MIVLCSVKQVWQEARTTETDLPTHCSFHLPNMVLTRDRVAVRILVPTRLEV
jgi:hypothetical protein